MADRRPVLIGLAIFAGLVVALLVFRQSATWRWVQAFTAGRDAIKLQHYLEAERVLRQALNLSQHPSHQAATRVALGEVLHRLGRLAEAEPHLRESTKMLEECHPEGHFEIARAYSLRGELELDRGQYAGAQRCFQHALAEDEKIANEARMLFTMQRLTEALLRQGNQNRALDVVEQCSALEDRFMRKLAEREGGGHFIMMTLPDLRFCQGEWADACRLYREKVEHFERLTGDVPGIDVGQYQLRLAAASEQTGDAATAAVMCRRAAETYRRAFTDDHPRVGISLARLAGVLSRQGDTRQAESALAEARDMLGRHGLAEHPELAAAIGPVIASGS